MLNTEYFDLGAAGDSRALLLGGDGGLAWASADHKPDREDEKARVIAAGGHVVERGCWRVSTNAGMDYVRRHEKGRTTPGEKAPNQLAVSRAFGDIELKEPDVSNPPPPFPGVPSCCSFV